MQLHAESQRMKRQISGQAVIQLQNNRKRRELIKAEAACLQMSHATDKNIQALSDANAHSGEGAGNSMEGLEPKQKSRPKDKADNT